MVILDLYMDRMDGYKVLAHKIIFSARGSRNEIDQAMSAGAFKFLPKT